MPRLNVNLSQEQYDFLKRLKGISISSWVRVMVNEGIYRAQKEEVASSQSKRGVLDE